MQQRQLRLGDILDDYCPRERRLTNHAVVAMIGADVKQTRCTTCDAEHEYKHAKVPRQRRKTETPAALYAQVSATAPKRVVHEEPATNGLDRRAEPVEEASETAREELEAATEHRDNGNGGEAPVGDAEAHALAEAETHPADSDEQERDAEAIAQPGESIEPSEDEGPVHRPLIRASLPRPEGQPPQSRPIPEFTIRQPGGRANRFRPRHPRGGGQSFPGNRTNGNVAGGPPRGGMRQGGGRPPQGTTPRMARRHGPGRKRSK